MVIKYTPFQRKDLELKRDIVTVSLNREERKILESLKYLSRCDQDSKVIKVGMEYLHNEIHSKSQEGFYLWLSNSRRLRSHND